MSRIADAKCTERVSAYRELQELIKRGTDEEMEARVRQAAPEGSDIISYGEYELSLLHVAAENNRAGAAALLVQLAGFDVDIMANFKRTPLHSAATRRLLRERDRREKFRDDKNHTRSQSRSTRQRRLWYRARQQVRDQRRAEKILSADREPTDSDLPPRYMFTYNYSDRLILARRDKSLSYKKIED